jgi:bifunctional non-homologous end joining protein LigD
MGEKNRVRKVFVDYLRNRRGASTVAAYSARARSGLPVSVPLRWEELDDFEPARWTIKTLRERMAGKKKDAWAPPGKVHTITATMKKLLGLK